MVLVAFLVLKSTWTVRVGLTVDGTNSGRIVELESIDSESAGRGCKVVSSAPSGVDMATGGCCSDRDGDDFFISLDRFVGCNDDFGDGCTHVPFAFAFDC
jgi:hypothetical protein